MAKKIVKYDVLIKSTKQVKQWDVPKFFTNDLNSVVFQFVVSDLTVEEQETATAITMIYMRDGSFFQNPPTDVSKVGNVFSYTLKENEGNHHGIAQIQLVVTIPGTPTIDYASQLYEFEVVSGLETKVAQEVMIYDWTTLTRDAQDYIDLFVANEATRQQQFADAQTQRNTDFGAAQTTRTNTFNQSETDRTTAFNTAEDGRATAETGRVTAESNRVTAETGRTTSESNRVTAESNRVTAESGRVTAESARVTAETNRATIFSGYNTRLTAEETATVNNKISAVKSKTFADVDARFEDVEFDTTMMGTNLAPNGDFSNGTSGWATSGASVSASNNTLSITATAQYGLSDALISVAGADLSNHKIYHAATINTDSLLVKLTLYRRGQQTVSEKSVVTTGAFARVSNITTPTAIATNGYSIGVYDGRASGWTPIQVKSVIAIDLTAVFGAGNEPTAEQMDGILAKFTNSWFSGTANLFRANATLNKLMAVDARTEFEAKNMISNGNIANGVTGWAPTGATLSAVNNTLSVVGDGTSLEPWAKQTLSTSGQVATDKQYIRARIRTTALDAVYIRLYTNISYKDVLTPVQNQWYDVSLIITGLLSQVILTEKYADAASASGKQLDVQYVSAINLTATFGAGKEPTLAEMDRLMVRYPNSWLDGVKPVQTIENLYNEKANKVQEAWITPTLLNGWVNVGGSEALVGYYKTETGEVRLKGLVKSGVVAVPIFTLPVGYRPLTTFTLPVISNDVLGKLVILATGHIQINLGSNNWVSLNNITFRAEV